MELLETRYALQIQNNEMIKKKMEANESAAYYAVLVAFDLVLLSWSLLHALTLSLCSLVFRVFKCFWDTHGGGN